MRIGNGMRGAAGVVPASNSAARAQARATSDVASHEITNNKKNRTARQWLASLMACALALTMMPSAGMAFAAENVAGGGSPLEENPAATDAETATDEFQDEFATSDEPQDENAGTAGSDDPNHVISTEGPEGTSGEISSPNDGDDFMAIPAASERINETMALQTRTVAQAESTRTYFLAQTLESTRTVPIVSANLPLDTGTVDVVEPEDDSSAFQEEEGDDGDDDPESDDSVGASSSLRAEDDQAESGFNGIAASSTVIGSFTYRGITYAVEPGGETVAIVAADYAKLPVDFIQAHTIVLPSMVSLDGTDYYTVSRIADYAFSAINTQTASQYGISSLPLSVGAEHGPRNGDEAIEDNAQAPDESNAGDNPSALAIETMISSANPVDDSSRVISTEASDSERSGEISTQEDILGITAITIPASITTIGTDAFTGADTLQYVIVSADNPNYSMYDGALYSADQQSLLLVPEGRAGAVRIAPSVAEVEADAFSHCASVEALVADPDSAASQLLESNDFYNKNNEKLKVVIPTNEEEAADTAESALTVPYAEAIEVEVGKAIVLSDLPLDIPEGAQVLAASSNEVEIDPNTIKLEELCDIQLAFVTVEGRNILDVVTVTGIAGDTQPYIVLEDSNAYGATAADTYGLDIKGGSLSVNFFKSERYFFSGKMDAHVSWTAGTASKPAAGSIVNVAISLYQPTGGESTREQLVNAGFSWGASETQELVGIKNVSTGSYTSLETIFSGDAFTLSFVMPSSGCSITTKTVSYTSLTDDTSFMPVFTERSNSIYNDFTLNATDAKWENPATGVQGLGSYDVTTYSTIGQSVITPTNSIPVRTGYMFTGWYTAETGGTVVSGEAVEGDSGNTYYAHWAAVKRSLTYTNASLSMSPLTAERCFLYDSKSFCGTLSWSSDTDTPAVGSIVTLRVTQYRPNAGEGTKDQLLNASLAWGATKDKEAIGIQNIETGSYVSFDTIYSGAVFTLSWIMPSTGKCTITTKSVYYRDTDNGTSFEPVYKDKNNYIVSLFNANGGNWMNPSTQTIAQGGYDAATYSVIGEPLSTPSRSIPVRTGYNFIGWYTDATGGSVASGIVSEDDNETTYYAHWEAATYSLSIKGATGVYPSVASSGESSRCMLYDNASFIATASWSSGTATKPSVGAIVTITVTQYRPNGGETTKDLLVNASQTWGADESKKVIAIRSTTTGAMVSLDSIYSGDVFSFSFAMPESGITLTSKNFSVSRDVSTFEPVYEERSNSICNHFVLNGTEAYWQNPSTGQLSNYSKTAQYYATTYSNVGETLLAPTDSIPVREGYIFTGWFTEPEGGHIVSGEARAADNGKTYYAHWGNKDSVYYFLRLNGNGASSSIPINWSIESGKEFSLDPYVFDRLGHTITSWTDDDDNVYESEVLYPPFADSTTTDLYAQWEPDVYIIEYDLNYEGAPELEKTVYALDSADFAVAVPADPPGYTFVGWSGTGLAGKVLEPLIQPSKEEKLGVHEDLSKPEYTRYFTANWEPHSYSVKFLNGDGGKITQEIADEVQEGFTYGETKDLEPVNLQTEAKRGYHLTGWRIGDPKTGPEVTVNSDGTWTMPAAFADYAPADGATVNLYCIWTPNDYKVVLHDGTKADAAQTGFVYSTNNEANKDKAITAASFTKTAYHITGWAFSQADADARTKPFTGATPVIDSATLAANSKIPAQGGTVDLYAVWEPDSYDVTLTTGRLDEGDGAWDLGMPTALGWFGTWTMSNNGKTAKNAYTVETGKALSVSTTVGGATTSVANLVLLPNPASKYFTFAGWKVVSGGVTLASYVHDGVTRYGFIVGASAQHAPIELEAQWTACDYSIQFGNVEHVDEFITGDLDASSTHDLKAFNGTALADTAGITVSEPTEIDANRYNSFTRWVTAADMTGVSGWTKDGDIWWSTGFTITKDNADAYFGADSPNGSQFSVAAEYDLVHFRIFLGLDGGALGDDDLETTWVTNGYDFTCESGDVTLPVPTKFGFELDDPKAWLLSGSDPAELLSQNASGDYIVPNDSYGDRTYVIQWRGKMDSYTVAIAPSVDESVIGIAPETDTFVAQHSKAMTEFAAPTAVPTRTDGYIFAGYFDTPEETGGKQYFTRDLASARAWDKEPLASDEPHVLYARWVKDADTGETVTPVKGSAIDIVANDVRGTEHPAFIATYNGTYRATTAGRVTVNVDSYELTDATPESIYKSFMDGEDGAEGTRYLLGFRVKSTGAVIAFSDIAMGNAFSFDAKQSELLGGTTAPSLALAADSIEVLYTDVPYDFGEIDPTPGEDDEIMAIWNANGGEFAAASAGAKPTASTTTTTAYAGEITRLALPTLELSRTGYTFTGWSKAAEHTTDADHTPDGANVMFQPTSIAPHTYFAHWTPRVTDVVFDGNGDDAKTKARVNGFTYDMMGTKLGSADVIGMKLPDVPVRTGYKFTGYFDAAVGGTQYYTSAGAQARAWDKVPSESGDKLHTLYAQWTRTTNTFVTDETSHTASIAAAKDGAPAEGKRTVIEGAYDGKVTFATVKTSVSAGYVPTGDDDVTITMYSYEFDTLDVLDRFQTNGAAQTEPPFLQGFRVVSTGCFIPLLTLDEGKTVTIECKGSDLTENVTLASFGLAADKVEPVYGTTPVIPSPTEDYDWPEPFKTEVVNIFDAVEGRFSEESNMRFMTAASVYMMQLTLPEATPDFKTDEGWSFEGWFTADGRQVSDKNGLITPAYVVESAQATTFYAHYTQARHAIHLSLGQAGDYPITGTVEDISAYAGQKVGSITTFPTASTATGGFYRAGFDFCGWYDGDTPYYVTDAAPAADKIAYAAVKDTSVTAPLYLTAKWQRIGYTLNFHWNDTTVENPVYVHAEADLVGDTAKKLSFGDAIANTWVPTPANPGYEFLGWYASRDFADASRFVEFDENGPASFAKKYFQTKDGARAFMPESGTARTIELYAKWATDEPAIPYKISIEAGEHGKIGQNLPNPYDKLTYRYSDGDILFGDLQSKYILADRGWVPSYWQVKNAEGQWERATTDRIPMHSTGDVYLKMVFAPEDGKYRVKLDLGENQPKANLTADDLEEWTTDEERPLTRPITVDMEDEIVFPASFRVSGYNGYAFDGWFRVFADGTVAATPTSSVVPKDLIEDKANGDATTFTYVAKWSPKPYTITFRQTATADASEDVNVSVASYEDSVTLPVPATVQNGHIFTNWGPTESDLNDTYATWISSATVSFADIAKAVYGLGSSHENRIDLVNNGHVTLYGNWTNALVGAEVPLYVNMLVDPHLMTVEVADTYWIGTSSAASVQVESVTYKMATDAGDVPGTAKLLASDDGALSANDFALTVRGDAEGSALSIPLGTEGVASTSLSDHGFRAFTADDPLLLKYGLSLPPTTNLAGFSELLNPKLFNAFYTDKVGETQHVSYPLAYLYYTVSLVPTTE